MINRNFFLFSILLIFVYLFVATVPSSASENGVEVSTFQGNATRGTLKELTPQKLVLQTADSKMIEWTTEEVANIVFDNSTPASTTAAANGYIVVRLFDGTKLIASDLVSENKNFAISCANGKKITVSIDDVDFVRFSVAANELFAEESSDFLKILRTKAPDDRLVISVTDSDDAKDSTLDYHSGVVQGITSKTVQFDLDGDVMPIPRQRVYGLIFHQLEQKRSETERADAICQLTEKNGSVWVLAEIRYDLEKNLFHWKTVSKIDGTTPFADCRSISFAQKNSVPLMQLTPVSVRYYPSALWADGEVQGPLQSLRTLSEAIAEKSAKTDAGPQDAPIPLVPRSGTPRTRPRENRSSTKTEQLPLHIVQNVQLDGKTYTQGYLLQAKTELVFDLNGDYKTLHGFAGIDDRLRPSGNAKLTIFGDGHSLFATTVRGDQPLSALNVNLKDVKTLTITVDFPDGISGGTRLNLVDMLLVK